MVVSRSLCFRAIGALLGLVFGLSPTHAQAIDPPLQVLANKHEVKKNKAALPVTAESIQAKMERSAKEAWFGRSCFLPTGVDPRSFGLGDDATLKCVDGVLAKHFYHKTDSALYPQHFNPDSECSLVTAIGLDPKTDITKWMKEVPAGEALKAALPAMGDQPKPPPADPLQTAIGREFGEKIKKLSAKQQASLSLCLYLKNVEYSAEELAGEQQAQKLFEDGLQKYVDEQRKIDPKERAKSWSAILSGGESLKAAAPATLECTDKNQPSFAEAMLYRENYLSESYVAAIAEWKTLNPALATKAQDREMGYLVDVRTELCTFAKINASAPEKLAELGASIAQTHKRLASSGKPSTSGKRQTPPAWVNQYLTLSVYGHGQNEPLARFVENGYFADPLLPGSEKEHKELVDVLNYCPAARDALAAKLMNGFYDYLKGAEPLSSIALRATAEAKKEKKNAALLPALVSSSVQAGIKKTRTVAELIAKGFLCPSADGKTPVSKEEADVAAMVANRIVDSKPELLDLFRAQLAEATPTTHDFIPTGPALEKLGEAKSHCILPDALEPRHYLTANLASARARTAVLHDLEVILFPDEATKAKLPWIAKSYLWHANGRLGKSPAAPAAGVAQETGLKAYFRQTKDKLVELAWDRLFENSVNAAQARKTFFDFDPKATLESNLKRVKESKDPVLAAAVLREELLNQNEAELSSQLGQGNALAANSERKALVGLRAHFCANLLTQGAEAVDAAKDLAEFAKKLNELTPADAKDKKPVAFHEGLLRLYLDLDPLHRKKLNDLLSKKECIVKYPEITESVIKHVLAPRAGKRLTDSERDRWFVQIEKHAVICEFIATLEDRSKKADKDKLLAELEKKSGEKLTGERRNALLTALLNNDVAGLRTLVGQLKALPVGTGVVTVKAPEPEKPAVIPVIAVELPDSSEMLIRDLPKGMTSAAYVTKAVEHLLRTEHQLRDLNNKGFADESHKRDLEKLMNAAWQHAFGEDFSKPTAYLKVDPAKRQETLSTLQAFLAEPTKDPKIVVDRTMGALEAEYWASNSPKSAKDPDVEKLLQFYIKEVAPLRAAREAAEKTRPNQSTLPALVKAQPKLSQSPAELVKGLLIQREELEKLLAPLRKKVAAGQLDAEEIKRIENLSTGTQNIFETWLLEQIETLAAPLSDADRARKKIETPAAPLSNVDRNRKQIETLAAPLSDADRARATHFLRLRRLAIEQIGGGKMPPPRPPSADLQANPRAVRMYNRGIEIKAAAGAIRAHLKADGGKNLGVSPQRLLADALKEHTELQRELNDLIAEANAGRIPAHVVSEALSSYTQARQELEESLIEEIMKDRPIPTSRSYPYPDTISLTFPTKDKDVGTWTLTGVPLNILAKHNNLADGLFEWYAAKSDCKSAFKRVTDKKWWHSSMESYFESDRETINYDVEEQNWHMKDWLCWAALLTPPLTGENIVERTRQADAYKIAYNKVRAYINASVLHAEAPDKDPHKKRLDQLLNEILKNDRYLDKELALLRDHPDPGERELYRKAVSFALRLPENRAGREVVLRSLIPSHVEQATWAGERGEGYSHVAPGDPRKASPGNKVTKEEVAEFKKMLAQAPSYWLSNEIAKSIADTGHKANFRELYDSLKASVKSLQKQADENLVTPLSAPNKGATPVPTLATAHADFLRDVYGIVYKQRNSAGRINFGGLAAAQLPFEKYKKMFEGNETLGKEEVPLTRALAILKAERAVLHSTLDGTYPTIWLSHFGGSLYGGGTPELDVKAGYGVFRSGLKPGQLEELKDIDAAMGLMIEQIQKYLTQKVEREQPGYSAFSHFAFESASTARELERWKDELITQSKPASHSTVAVNETIKRIEKLYEPVTVNPAQLTATFDTKPARGSYPRGGFFSSSREKIGFVPSSNFTTPPLTNNYVPDRKGSPLADLFDFQQKVEHSQTGAILNKNALMLQRNLDAYYGLPLVFGDAADFTGRISGYKARAHESAKAYQKEIEAMMSEYYRGSHYLEIPPEAEETWKQMPPFLREQLSYYVKDRLSLGRETLNDPLFRRERALLMEPFPGRTVEFFRTAGHSEAMKRGTGVKHSLCGGFINQQNGKGFDRFQYKGGVWDKVSKFMFTDLMPICDERFHWDTYGREQARARATTLLLELYKDHPLIKSARTMDAKEWLEGGEVAKKLKALLAKEIDFERNALATKGLADLDNSDYAKQMLIMALHMLEETDNTAGGQAAYALEQAKGGMDRFSPIHSAFYAALEEKYTAGGEAFLHQAGEGVVWQRLGLALDKIYRSHPEDHKLYVPASLSKDKNVTPEQREAAEKELFTPAEPRLGRTLSFRQRLPILTWDKERLSEFGTLLSATADASGHKTEDSAQSRALIRRIQLGETSVPALYQEFDTKGIARAKLGDWAVIEKAKKDADIVKSMAEGKELTAAQLKYLVEEAQRHWVEDGALEQPPRLRLRNEITPSALAAYRDGVFANFQKQAVDKLMDDNLWFAEMHFSRGNGEQAVANRLAFKDFLARAANGEATPARDGDGVLSKMLVGPPWGIFHTEQDANDFAARMNTLLQNSAQIALSHQGVQGDRRAEAIKAWVNGELQSRFAGWNATHGHEAVKAVNFTARMKDPKAEVTPFAELTGLYDSCRVAGYESFRKATADDVPPVNPALAEQRTKMVKLSEEMRTLQISIRRHRHLLMVVETKRPSLKASWEKAEKLKKDNQLDDPSYVEDEPRGKMKEKLNLMGQMATQHETALRAEERRFTAAFEEFKAIMGKAAAEVSTQLEGTESPVDKVRELAEEARVGCLSRYATERYETAKAMGFTSLNEEEFKQREFSQAASYMKWHASLRRAVMDSLRHPYGAGGKEIPYVVDKLLKTAGETAGFGRLTPAQLEAIYEKEKARASAYLAEERAAMAQLEKYGLTRDALSSKPPDFSRFKIPAGEKLTEADLRAKLREASRVLYGEEYQQSMSKEGPPPWDKHPLADLIFTEFREGVIENWAKSGRLSALPVNGDVVAYVRVNAKKDDFGIVFENLQTAKDRGQAAIDELTRAAADGVPPGMLADPKLFADMRAGGNHLIDWTGHERTATAEVNEKLKVLSETIESLEGLDGLEFKFEGRKVSGSTVAAHMAADRDLGVRSDLSDTLEKMHTDQIWKAVSVAVFVATVAVTIATAGAATPLMMAVHSGLGMAATVQGLHLVGYAINDAAYYSGATWAYSKEKNFTDSGPDNLIGSALFFAGGFGGALILNLGARAAMVANLARAEGMTVAEAATLARTVQASAAAGEVVEGTAAYAQLLRISGQSTLEAAVAEVAAANTTRGALLTYLNKMPKRVNTFTAYTTGVAGRFGADYIGAEIHGREFRPLDSLVHHAFSELTTALFLGGFDRRIADAIGPRIFTLFGMGKYGLDYSFPLKLAAAGTINRSINKVGGFVGDEIAQSDFSRKMDKLLSGNPQSPAEYQEIYMKMAGMLEDREKQKKAKEEAYYQELVHSLVVDVGMFAGRASRDSTRAQSGARAFARAKAGMPLEKAYAKMFTDQQHGWADFLNHPIQRMVPRLHANEPKPTEFAFQTEGGVQFLKLVVEKKATDPKAAEIYEREMAGLEKALTDAHLPKSSREEIEQFIDTFATSKQFHSQPLLVMREVDVTLPDKSKAKKKKYEGSMQSLQDWARREIQLKGVRALQEARMNAKTDAAREKALKDEQAGWIATLEADARLVSEVPIEVLTAPGNSELRETVTLAFVAVSGVEPAFQPAYAFGILRFLQVVHPENAAVKLNKSTPVGRLDLLYQAAGPRDTVNPLKFMDTYKIGIKDYQAIYGQSDVVREIAILRTAAWAKAQKTPIKDAAEFGNFVRREWATTLPAPAYTEKEWIDRFTASKGKP